MGISSLIALDKIQKRYWAIREEKEPERIR